MRRKSKFNKLQKLKVILLLTLFLFTPFREISCLGFEEWSTDIGGEDTESFKAIQETSDGGFIIVGYLEPYRRQDHDLYVVKTDSLGEVEWDLTFGDSRDDDAYSVLVIEDGYLVVGGTKSFGVSLTDILLLKINKQGEIVWQKTYGGENDDVAYSIIGLENSEYIIAGATASYGAGSSDAWVIKIDSDGEVIWNMTLGGTGFDQSRKIIMDSSGNFILIGDTSSYGAGWSDAWLVRMDKDWIISWNKTYGGSANDFGKSVIETDDGYIFVGTSESFGDNLVEGYAVKVDLNGDVTWEKTYGGSSDDYIESIAQVPDLGYISVGYTTSTGTGESDVWVLYLSSTGEPLEETYYGGSSRDRMYIIIQTLDTGYVLAGLTWSFGSTGNGYLIKLTLEEPEPEPEPEPEEETSNGGGIPGFTVWSIAFGLAVITFMLYIRKQ